MIACLTTLVAVLGLPAVGAAAPKWNLRTLPPQPTNSSGIDIGQIPLFGASCPSESLCVVGGGGNTIAVSQSPLGGADAWSIVHPTYDEPKKQCLEEGNVPPAACSIPRGSIRSVSCSPELLCVAVGYEGSIYVSTNPTGGAGAWSVTDAPKAVHLTGVSCPTASLCVAVSGGFAVPGSTSDTVGSVLTSVDPASGHWQADRLSGSPDLRGVSCATPVLCVAVAKGGGIYVSTNPTGGASAWRRVAAATPRDLFAVSCVATLLCAAGDLGGNILTSTDPTGGGGFAGTNADGSVQITGLSCPTPQGCVAVTNNADVLTSTDPTGPPGAWTFENLVPFEVDKTGESPFVNNALFGASCASTSLCVLVGMNSRIFTAADPFAAPAPPRAAAKRGRLRPRTKLVFAEGFWGKTVTRRDKVKARFRFYSRDRARRFLCKHDRRRWRRCRSPHRYWATVGNHVLRVRAVGQTGLRGPITKLRFEVMRPDRR